MFFVSEISGMLAAAGASQGGAQPQGGLWGSLLIMVPLFAIMYFLMIRPQQKKQKEHDDMLTRVRAGDKVMTSSGMFGTVVRVTDKRVTIAIADRVNVEFVLAAIADILTDDKETDDEKEEKKEEKKA